MKKYYHGSINPNLINLDIISKCNENPSVKCAYITDNFAYSLFYIRDMDINIVTAWVNKEGIACYEEQFENQLEIMYKNKSGYIYVCENEKDFIKSTTNGIYYSTSPIYFNNRIYVENAFESIKNEIENNKIRITKFQDVPKERIELLYQKIAEKILKNNFYEGNKKLKSFYKKHYYVAWDLAEKQNK